MSENTQKEYIESSSSSYGLYNSTLAFIIISHRNKCFPILRHAAILLSFTLFVTARSQFTPLSPCLFNSIFQFSLFILCGFFLPILHTFFLYLSYLFCTHRKWWGWKYEKKKNGYESKKNKKFVAKSNWLFREIKNERRTEFDDFNGVFIRLTHKKIHRAHHFITFIINIINIEYNNNNNNNSNNNNINNSNNDNNNNESPYKRFTDTTSAPICAPCR